jgi:hypothetical protein
MKLENTCTYGEMTLDEAIKHCEDKIDDTPCGKDHLQLRNWLIELKHLKNDKEMKKESDKCSNSK